MRRSGRRIDGQGSAALGCAALSGRLWRAVDRAQLVAVRVADVAQVHRAEAAFAQARRVFTGGAAMGDRDVVKRLDLLGRVALEANRAAIGDRRRFAVDGLGDAEEAAVVPVEEAGVPGGARVADRLACAEQAEHGVVEPLRPFKIIRTDHYMVEHGGLARGIVR